MARENSHLLVIDDDPALQAMLARQLDEAGYDVHIADDGIEGLELTREVKPDFVFCDWMMPRLDGLGYCRSVKADPDLRSTYVTMLTARNELDDRIVGLDAGADDFLIKPVPLPELLARVRAGLRMRQLQRELADAQHSAALLEIAVTMGHEINNPLTALFGHLELAMQYLTRSDRNRMGHHIRQAGDMAARISEVGRRLTSLREPRTKRYLGEMRMLDID